MKTIFQSLTVCLAMAALFLVENLQAQPGCTDPQADNYDPQATENDGSCTYPATSYSPVQIAVLPTNLTECSGLAFFGDRLWTHLDGGNTDQLFEIDTLTGVLKTTATIPNSSNIDWEDLAEDDDHIYIGNFGNNFGNRTDLGIYKIKKTDLVGGTPTPELIEFSFSDQTDFTHVHNEHNYDCEAFFYWQDSLHLFSKNWLDSKTRHYVLPTTPGTHVAELRDSLAVQGQITGADISDEGVALLLGYNIAGETFMWMLYDFSGSDVFSGNKRRITLGSAIFNSQVEGIAFRDATRGYISSEEYSILPPKLLGFDIAQWLQGPLAITEVGNELGVSIYPNPTHDKLTLFFENMDAQTAHLSIMDPLGKKVMEKGLEKHAPQSEWTIDVSQIPPGAYWLTVDAGNKRASLLFYKK